jgi:hypothetical protein
LYGDGRRRGDRATTADDDDDDDVLFFLESISIADFLLTSRFLLPISSRQIKN